MRRALLLVLVVFALCASRVLAQDSSAPTPEPSVVAIQVDGERRYTEEQLRAALGQQVGRPLDRELISRGQKTLWDVFKVNARVQYRVASGGVELLLIVDEMNVDLEPRFVGNAEVDNETLRKWALLDEKGELYLFQAERVRQRLLEGYKKDGYAFAEVEVVRRGGEVGPNEEGQLPDVIFELREGPQVRVKDVLVRGNRSLPETGAWWWRDGLTKLAQVQMAGPWLFNWKGEKYVREALDADLLAMREVYRDKGFLDAVVEVEELEFSPDRSGVKIHVVVDEGERYRVSRFDIAGVTRSWNAPQRSYDEKPAELVFAREELLALCKLEPGAIFDRAKQKSDAFELREFYGKRGYLSHSALQEDFFEFLEPELVFDPERREVAVTYRLAQGRQRKIREVLFSGARHTRDRVLRREIDVQPGETADIEKVRKGLNRLYSTAFFTDEMRPLEHKDPTYTFKPTPDPDWVDLEFQVEEGRVVNFQVQGGVDSNNGLFARISLQMKNFDLSDPPRSLWSLFSDVYDKEAFHGAGQRLDLDLMPGTVVDQYRFRFLEPDLFRSHYDPFSFEVEFSRRDRRYRFFDEDRFETRARLGRQFGRELGVFLGFTVQQLTVDDLEAPLVDIADPDELPLPDSIYQQVGDTEIAGLTFDVQYQKLDNYLNPSDGMKWSLKNGAFGGPFGGDFQFVRSQFEVDWFYPLGAAEDEGVRPSIHIGFGAGVADAFGETSETPYTERFFSGGSRKLRGWSFRGVGPNKKSNSLGGESALDATFEYRHPLYTVAQPGTYKEIETFRLTLFADAGILDPDPYKADLDELRASLGFGLGMVQPFPITLNFGFPIEDGEGDRKQLFSFSLFTLWF